METYRWQIKFCYYKVAKIDINENEQSHVVGKFNLTEWLMSMKSKALVQRNVKLSDCVVNLGEYRFDSETKLVKYVFERDKDKLFLKYIKQTLIVGVLVIIVSVTVYFRDQYKDTWYEK